MRPIGRARLGLFVFILIVSLSIVGFLVLVRYALDFLMCIFVWLGLFDVDFGFLVLLFFVCVVLALCMYVLLFCVFRFGLYLLVLLLSMGGSCGGNFL